MTDLSVNGIPDDSFEAVVLLGLPLEEAGVTAGAHGYYLRNRSASGYHNADQRDDRIEVWVDHNDVVVEAIKG